MMKKILCATDFSHNAGKALTYALSLADKTGATLLLLNVYDIPTNLETIPVKNGISLEEEARQASDRELQAFYLQYKGDFTTVPEYISHREHSVTDGIVHQVKRHAPDLVVVGTHGASKVREILFGSTTKFLIRKLRCPVLAVPENAAPAAENPLQQVVYASALNDDDIPAIQTLLRFLAPFEPKVMVVHVEPLKDRITSSDFDWFRSMLAEQVPDANLEFKVLYSDNTFETLQAFLHARQTQLLGMLEQEPQTVLKGLFHRDLVQRVGFHSATPILRFRERE